LTSKPQRAVSSRFSLKKKFCEGAAVSSLKITLRLEKKVLDRQT
jgi:hypothetical protein